jgi:hypothetical protein
MWGSYSGKDVSVGFWVVIPSRLIGRYNHFEGLKHIFKYVI